MLWCFQDLVQTWGIDSIICLIFAGAGTAVTSNPLKLLTATVAYPNFKVNDVNVWSRVACRASRHVAPCRAMSRLGHVVAFFIIPVLSRCTWAERPERCFTMNQQWSKVDLSQSLGQPINFNQPRSKGLHLGCETWLESTKSFQTFLLVKPPPLKIVPTLDHHPRRGNRKMCVTTGQIFRVNQTVLTFAHSHCPSCGSDVLCALLASPWWSPVQSSWWELAFWARNVFTEATSDTEKWQLSQLWERRQAPQSKGCGKAGGHGGLKDSALEET